MLRCSAGASVSMPVALASDQGSNMKAADLNDAWVKSLNPLNLFIEHERHERRERRDCEFSDGRSHCVQEVSDVDLVVHLQKQKVMTVMTSGTMKPKSEKRIRRFRHRPRRRRPRYRPRYGQRTVRTTSLAMTTPAASGLCSGNLGGGLEQASVFSAFRGNGLATFDFNLGLSSSCCLRSNGPGVNPVFIRAENQDSRTIELQYFLSSPQSPNRFLLAANETPGANFEFNVSTSAFNGETASGTWTLRVSMSPSPPTPSVVFFAFDARITLQIEACPPSSTSLSGTGTSTTGPSTTTGAVQICQGTQSVQNLASNGITIGPPVAGTATNTSIIFNANLPCSLIGGTVLLDLGLKEGISIDATLVVTDAEVDPNLRLFLRDGAGVEVACEDVTSREDGNLIEYTGTCSFNSSPTLGIFVLIVETSEPAQISIEQGAAPPTLQFIGT
eukprot:s5255_g2.t1